MIFALIHAIILGAKLIDHANKPNRTHEQLVDECRNQFVSRFTGGDALILCGRAFDIAIVLESRNGRACFVYNPAQPSEVTYAVPFSDILAVDLVEDRITTDPDGIQLPLAQQLVNRITVQLTIANWPHSLPTAIDFFPYRTNPTHPLYAVCRHEAEYAYAVLYGLIGREGGAGAT